MARNVRNRLHPIVELGRSLWLITNWPRFETSRAKQPNTIFLRRLTKQEENLLADTCCDFECWSALIVRMRKRLKGHQKTQSRPDGKGD